MIMNTNRTTIEQIDDAEYEKKISLQGAISKKANIIHI